MSEYLLSIDQGTSSSRAIIFDKKGKVVAVKQKPLKLHCPRDGWVEQNPVDILNDTIEVIRDVIGSINKRAKNIVAAGITNQRETTILWNRKTGEPVYNAIVWQDRRTASLCDELRKTGIEEIINRKTGLLLDPYFSATKIKWILDEVEGVKELAEKGDIAFGTVDSFLLWHLTSGQVHASDPTNASRTMLYNITNNEWDYDLLDIFGIPPAIMPVVRDNISDFSQIEESVIGQKIPIYSLIGDQQSALIGQGCVNKSMIKATYGTGCFVLMNTGDKCCFSQSRMLSTIAYRVDGKTTYALEGSIFNSGTAIDFLGNNLGFFKDTKDSEKLALSVDSTHGVYFVPAFTGLGAPFWNPEARGIICGLTRDTLPAHITRAALDAQGYQTRDLIDAMQKDSGFDISLIRADGGLVANRYMCQFLADIISHTVEIPKVTQATAWGAACLAGVQAGLYTSLEDTASLWRAERTYNPTMDNKKRHSLYDGWKHTLSKTL